MKKHAVSVVVPMRNSETTVLNTFQSILEQEYPVAEIIVVDNMSSDQSVAVVKNFAKKIQTPVSIILNSDNTGVGASYNAGALVATSELLVFMHSDSVLPSQRELGLLVQPLVRDSKIVASYSTILMPIESWRKNPFWQRYVFSRAVGTQNAGLNTKFDCIRKRAFLRIGGFLTDTFGENIGNGAEDADLHIRLKKEGPVKKSEARVEHVHYLGKEYGLSELFRYRKMLASTYGSHIRHHFSDLDMNALVFLVKPALAILPFIPHFFGVGLVCLLGYSIWYPSIMYREFLKNKDIRIFSVPIISIILLYYEVFWMLSGVTITRRNEGKKRNRQRVIVYNTKINRV